MRFLESLHGRASELIMVGDVLDYWFEYRMVVPRGHIRFFGALARLADSGVKITWLTGNHDIWLFDYLAQEIGLRVVDGYEVREIYGNVFSQPWRRTRKIAPDIQTTPCNIPQPDMSEIICRHTPEVDNSFRPQMVEPFTRLRQQHAHV